MKLTLPKSTALSDAETRTKSLSDSAAVAASMRRAVRELESVFGEPFSLVDADTGEIAYASPSALSVEINSRVAMLAEVARQGRPHIVDEEAPLLLLAIPLAGLGKGSLMVALGAFSTGHVDQESHVASAARVFGIDSGRALQWAQSREVWSPRILLRLAHATLENLVRRHELKQLKREINEAVCHARDTYVELGLLHRLTRHLDLADDETELWRNALSWLGDAVPAECLAAVACRDVDDPSLGLPIDHPTGVLIHGASPIAAQDLSDLMHRLAPDAARRPLVLNRPDTALPTWPCPVVRELACVPIEQGRRPRGWLMAVNHRGAGGDSLGEFGSVELRLLGSIATILGIHSSNALLFNRQSELFASSVRALTSAVDAKDCYTAGHSDRVARIAVCLAEQLGLSKECLETIYLGGLLHDIGKIGIDDRVLNKATRLTDEEFRQFR
ncbi:MAG: HD domain-containing protein, partial [Planctomycetota bacterium]